MSFFEATYDLMLQFIDMILGLLKHAFRYLGVTNSEGIVYGISGKRII